MEVGIRRGEVFGSIPRGESVFCDMRLELLWQFTVVIKCDPVPPHSISMVFSAPEHGIIQAD